MSVETVRGSSEYLTAPSSSIWNFGTTTDFSISMWLKRITDEDSNETLIARGWYGTTGVWALIVSSNEVQVGVAGSGLKQGGFIAVDGVWRHLVITVDRDGTLDTYIDTVVDVNAGTFNGDVTNAEVLGLGALFAFSNWGDHASIRFADVGIYNTLLTVDQISSIFNGRLTLEHFPKNRISYWKLDVPGDAAYHAVANGDLGLTDRSGSGNDFVLGTAPDWVQDSPGLHSPSRPHVFAATAAGLSIPVAMAYYRHRRTG